MIRFGLVSTACVADFGNLYYPKAFLVCENYMIPIIVGLTGLAYAHAGVAKQDTHERNESIYSGSCLALATIALLAGTLLTWHISLNGHPDDPVKQFLSDVTFDMGSTTFFFLSCVYLYAGIDTLTSVVLERIKAKPFPF